MSTITLEQCVIHVSGRHRLHALYRNVLGMKPSASKNGFMDRIGADQRNGHWPDMDSTPVARQAVMPGNSDLCFEWDWPISQAVAHLEQPRVEVEPWAGAPLWHTCAQGEGMSVYFYHLRRHDVGLLRSSSCT